MWLERLYDEFTTPRRWRGEPRLFVGILFVALGALVFVVGGVFAAITGQTAPAVFAVGFLCFVLGAFALITVGSRGRGREDPRRSRACPKCGAPPRHILSAHGLTKCEQCGEPYFVS